MPANVNAPALAREALEALDAELEGVRDSARLLVSELVSSSVRHAGLGPEDKIDLRVDSAPSAVRIEVADTGPGLDPQSRSLPPTESEFGYFFIDELADRWGTDENGIWFELDRS